MWTTELTADQVDQVLALAARAAAADGVEPLNEEAHFALRTDTARHLLAVADGELVGYLQWQPSYRTAQLVVDPAHRRQGHGRSLLGRLRDVLPRSLPKTAFATEIPGARSRLGSEKPGDGAEQAAGATDGEAQRPAGDGPAWGVWAFGDLEAAQGFAAASGLAASRGLLVMERPLAGVTAPRVPDGLSLRGFEPQDAEAFLAVNAAAFAHHPEQGALDAAGLASRMSEPWFDPSGLILGFDAEGLAGFHWTKREGGLGEVYVIGVAPRAQGRGYGRVLLEAGLDHLARTGADRVVLYVDMSEPVAVRMYESAGFHVASRDVLYGSGAEAGAVMTAVEDEDTVELEQPDLPADRFSDRELSWLSFNNRVLDLAKDAKRVPLLERARFLAIFSSNLDEFFMVRVAGLKRRMAAGVAVASNSGLMPRELHDAILSRTRELVEDAAQVFATDVRPALAQHGIEILRWDELNPDARHQMTGLFE
ncbi:MAG: mycothiol synthase, partial [Actinobacteria bacterium]|nr:mycothiol synthase [Actinomycetota bacterium]